MDERQTRMQVATSQRTSANMTHSRIFLPQNSRGTALECSSHRIDDCGILSECTAVYRLEEVRDRGKLARNPPHAV